MAIRGIRKTRSAILFGLFGLSSGGCALLGYDLSDYGVVGSESDATTGDATTDQKTSSIDGSDPGLDASDEENRARADADATVATDAPYDAPYFEAGGCSGFAHRIFVTSDHFTAGQIGSLGGGDVLCQKAADAAGLGGGQFIAWLSDDNTDAISRVGPTSWPYVLVNKSTLVACGSGGGDGGLTRGVLLHAIDMTEKQTSPQSSAFCGGGSFPGVWTGTTYEGKRVSGQNCAGWTSSDTSSKGTVGRPDLPEYWSYACSGQNVCGLLNGLYCIEK